MWCISGNLPYLGALSAVAAGVDASATTFKLNASELYPPEEPKDAMTKLAVTLA